MLIALMSRKTPAWTHQIAPSSFLYFSSPHAKCAATSGDAVQSRHLVGNPLCWATASTDHSDCLSSAPALAYFLKLRRSDRSTMFGRVLWFLGSRARRVTQHQLAPST